MSRVDRDQRYSIKLILVLAALSIVAIGAMAWGISKHVEYNGDAERSEAHYYRDTYSPARNACLRLPPKDQPYCVAEANDAARKYTRDERDLVAQRIMSVWTFLTGGAAIVGVILSIVGVFLVWTTFQESREANRIMRMEGRPWIEINNVRVVHYVADKHQVARGTVDAFSCLIVFDLANTGGTPALLLFRDGAGFNPDIQSGRVKRDKIGTDSSKIELVDDGFFIAPGGKATHWFLGFAEPSSDGGLPVFLRIVAVYTTSARDVRMETVVTGIVGERQQDTHWMPNDTPIQLSMEGVKSGKQRRIEAMQVRTVSMT